MKIYDESDRCPMCHKQPDEARGDCEFCLEWEGYRIYATENVNSKGKIVTGNDLRKVILPAQVFDEKRKKWVVPFTKKQYQAVVDYLVTIRIIKD